MKIKSEQSWFPTILFTVFLVLKLCGVIDWSWWWVTAPLWMSFAILVVLWLVMVMGVIGAAIIASKIGD